MKRFVALGIGLAVLAGCANSPPRVDYNETVQRILSYSGEPINRFTTMTGIRNWEVIAEDRLVLYTGVNEAYLVKVWTCPELRYARTIEVVSALDHSVSRSDKVIVGNDSCPIREIRQIDVFRWKADKEASKKQTQG